MARLIAIALLWLAAATAPATAAERITSFESEVTVNADASLDVREAISVTAEGKQIRHGIFRDFPTIYTDRNGQRVIVGFTVTGVTRNGRPEPYVLESLRNGTRIRIGDRDVFLEEGTQRYEVTYRTTRQVGFFETFDELYWNVTGNGWDFPIERARVVMRLPSGAGIIQHAAFTGRYGTQGRDSRVLEATGNIFSAETTAPLQPREGFTVAVAWQKGLVAPPSTFDRLAWWIRDNAGYVTLALGLLASLGYFLFAWNRVGRDPPRSTIIPLFRPPDGLGPAAVRYVSRYGYDETCLAAAMVQLAVSGRLKIAETGRNFTITKLPEPSGKTLADSEAALYAALPEGSTELKQANRARITAAEGALDRALKRDFEGKAFLHNLGWFQAGLALSVACLVLGALLLPGPDIVTGVFAVLWTAAWWGAVVGIGWSVVKGWRGARGLWARISSLSRLIFLIPAMGAGIMGTTMIFTDAHRSAALYALAGTVALLGLLNVVFFFLLRTATPTGRKLLDQIEGFRLYLSTAEEERLKVLHPPEKTPELFERYLPYAMALDCENEWNAKFATILAAAAAAGATAPSWYSGQHWNPDRGFTGLGRSLAASAAAAATPPGRVSGSGGHAGSGGGGYSGGGGGGGGGGGW